MSIPEAPDGLSGLATDGTGQLWAVAEGGALVELDSRGHHATTIPITGLAKHLELESIAFLANGDIAIGTETDVPYREFDLVLLARFTANELQIYDRIPVAYRMWGISPKRNQGIEGICATSEVLIVSGEPTLSDYGGRYAPLGVYSFATSSWSAIRLELTSETGKIAGLACRQIGAAVHFLAIERHFGVAHILAGQLDATQPVVAPTVVLDLSGTPDNLEGIAWLEDNSIAIVTDNFYRGARSADSKLLFSTLSHQASAPH